MDVLSLILAVVALVVAIIAYEKVGGLADVKKQIDQFASSAELRKSVDTLTAVADTLREKTIGAIEKMEDIIRRKGRQEKEPAEGKTPEKRVEVKRIAPPTAGDFQNELESLLATAQQRGESLVDIKSGHLHRLVGGYPGRSHRMPMCCAVMKRNMKAGDEILQQPPSGQGANLIMRFKLPR